MLCNSLARPRSDLTLRETIKICENSDIFIMLGGKHIHIDNVKTKLVISIVSMLLYSNTLKHGFVYDDR